MKVDENARYLESHEYAKPYDEYFRIGISDQAQQSLGDIVYADLPAVGAEIKAGSVFCVLESAKAASDLYAPLTGVVVAVNEVLKDDPGLLNRDCYTEGWLITLKSTVPVEWEGLMESGTYKSFCNGE